MADFEFRWDMSMIDDILEGGTEKRLMDFAEAVIDDAKINAPKKTGMLKNSIGYIKKKEGEIDLVALSPYAVYVEFGTKYKSARPYLLPAIHRNEKILTREGKE